MEKCKFCEAELEQGVTLCPSCGKDNTEEIPAEETAVEAAAEEGVCAETVCEEASAEEAAAEEAAAEEAAEQSAAEEATEIKEGVKATPGKMALAVIAIVVLVALIIGLLVGGMGTKQNVAVPSEEAATESVETEPTVPPTTPADTGENNETHKGSYTVSDEQAIAGADTVVATMGDKTLTNAQLQVHYWSYVSSYLSSEYGYQAMMYGMINMAQGLDTQISMADPGLTWQQYFLKCALQNWQSLQSMALEAEANGFTMEENAQKTLDAIPAQMEETAKQYGIESVDALLAMNLGAGVALDDFTEYQKLYYQGVPYYNDFTTSLDFTQEEVEAFFQEHEEEYAQQGLGREDKMVDVRHCLIMPEGASTETIRYETFPDEAWAAAEKQAQELLDAWKKGDKTEESFAEMANEHTADGNDSNADGVKDGGLYTGVTKGQMVAEFENWCFDESRKPGDVGIVKTEFGYHIMYFVGGEVIWPHYAEQDLIAMKENEFLGGILAKHPVEVDYSAIELAAIALQ